MNLNSFKSEVAKILRGNKPAEEIEPEMDSHPYGGSISSQFVYHYS